MAPSFDLSIAVIGMAGRFPGAPDLEAFWRNLAAGVESISFFSDAELLAAGLDPALLRAPGCVKARAVLDGAEKFDAGFFGFTASEAEVMDPQFRVFLECAWQALEDGGYDPEPYPGKIAVFAGASIGSYLLNNLHNNPRVHQAFNAQQVRILNRVDTLATRASYKLSLRGPAVTVQTTCSTGLVAVHLACQSLLNGECDMALAGAVAIFVPQVAAHLYQEGGIASPDGHCRAFDDRAEGTVGGNGAGVVLLKRLADAVADGDHVEAVIRGSAINNDGARKVGYTAPSVDGQAEVIADALAMARVQPSSISYVEAHGTATPLGDPVEVEALTQAFRSATRETGFCALGSVKTNIGHLDSAAGIAGLLKTVLALKHRQLPPSLHFEKPNRRIDFAHSPFYVNRSLADWSPRQTPRRAGVSSFGIGGTNAHVVLEEASAAAASGPARPLSLLCLSARSEAALAAAAAQLRSALESRPEVDLADVAFTLSTGRRAFARRRVLVCRDREDALALLGGGDSWRTQEGAPPSLDRPVVFLFPGQGSQYPGMGQGLYQQEPVFREHVDRCAGLLEPLLGYDLRQLLYPAADVPEAEAAARLRETGVAQPALFAVEYAMAQLLLAWGVRPQAMAGHSLGELVAACLAGVMSLEDALTLVAERARLLQSLPEGAMLAVPLSEAEVLPLLGAELALAAVNDERRCVVSGPLAAVAELERALAGRGIDARRLHTSRAFHSALVEPVLAEFGARVRRVRLKPPALPYVSNLTGTWIEAGEATDPDYWVRHLRQTVRFGAGVAELARDPSRLYLEVGPGRTLSALVPAGGIATLRHPQEERDDAAVALLALGRLWLAGGPVDWRRLYAGQERRRLSLPTYPFERQTYWIDPPPRGAAVEISEVERPAAPAPPSPAPAAVLPEIEPADPEAAVLAELLAVVAQVSGARSDGIDADQSFFDLGLDSLLMMQLSRKVQDRFGQAVAFRQLFEELATPRVLAAHLRQTMPAAALAALSRPAGKAAAEEAPAVAPAQVEAFGPFRPHRLTAREGSEGLSAAQQSYLGAFVERYNLRTGKSKQFAEANRPRLADNRAALGFRQQWKDLVYPILVERSAGSHLWDADGNEYVDLVMGFGANLFGHSPEFVSQAVKEQLECGVHLGAQIALAGEVAELITGLTGTERVAFCNTGSEAVMAALRMARAATGRLKIALFAGSYHGISDGVLARPPAVPGGRPAPVALGIPPGMVEEVVVLEYGAEASLETLHRRCGELAAVLVEPVQSARPDFAPGDFLRELRRLTAEAGTALIFDEAVTGFRCHPGGAQALFGIQADVATYSKIVGGGMPMGVIAGRREYLDAVDGGSWLYGDDSYPRANQTFFAGTFSKHPLALAAARAVLRRLTAEGPALQNALAGTTAGLTERLNGFFTAQQIPLAIVRFGSQFRFAFAPQVRYGSLFFYHLMLKHVHLWEGRTSFLSTAHTDADLDRVASAVEESVLELRDAGFLPIAAAPALAAVPAAVAGPARVPLIEAQEQIWVMSQMGEQASRAYNEASALRFHGPLDIPALAAALQTLIDRHEALRTAFSAAGDEQVITPSLRLALPVLDLSGLDAARREAEAGRVLAELAAQVFDLTAAPLARFRLLRLAAGEHVLSRTVHHLVFDGWSSGVLTRELAALYVARHRREAPALAAAPRFSDYARAELARRSSPAMERAAAYWHQQFSGELPVLELPADLPRPARQSFRGARLSAWLEAPLAGALRRLAARQGATLLMILLRAYQLLLHRLTGQDDVVVGLPAAGQSETGWGSLIGYCINLLPLRSRLAGDPTFTESLAAVRGSLLDAYEHQIHPFARLVKTLGVARDPGRPPLVATVFNLERGGGAGADLAGVTVASVPASSRASKLELNVNAVDVGDRLLLEWDYATDLFTPPTVRRFMAAYETLLAGIAAGPEQRLSALPLLPPAEAQQVCREWNDTARDFGPATTLTALLRAQARRTPQAVAVTADGGSLTYEELDRQASRLAQLLRLRGAGPEVCVGVFMERSLEMVVALLGILKAGAAYVPLDPEDPPQRLAFIVSDAAAPLVVVQAPLLSRYPAPSASEVVLLDAAGSALAGYSADEPANETGPGNAAYVIYTSGSTGRPKGAVNHHAGVVNRLLWMQERYRLGAEDRVLQKTPFSFDVSVWEFFWPLLTGARLVMARPGGHRDPAYLGKLIAEQGITTLHFVPSMLQVFLEDGEATARCSSVRRVIVSGEALSPELRARFQARLGAELHNLYGPTEAAIDVTSWDCGHEGLRGAVPIGRPIFNLSLHVLDRHLRPVPVGVAGELHIGGVGLARGYLRRPDLTAERFRPSPLGGPGERLYQTGDRARFLEDGSLEYLGRLDHQVKISGFRIELGEIESCLRGLPAVRDAVVLARPDAAGQRRLVAYLALRDGARAERPDPAELRRLLRASLPEHMVPSRFVLLAELPLTASGKLDRRALPDPEAAAPVEAERVAPRDEVEELVFAVWRQAFGTEAFGVHQNFFDLGGESLRAARIMTQLRQLLQVDVNLSTFLAAPTVAELSAALVAADPRVRKIAQLRKRVEAMSPEEKQRLLKKMAAESGPPGHGRAGGERNPVPEFSRREP